MMRSTKSAINYSKLPKSLDYKESLSSFNDHITDTRKISIVPTNSTTYGSSQTSEAIIFVDDSSLGSMLHPDSCYLTCDIQSLASGSASATSLFNSSANDVIERIQIRSKRSRIQLVDCRDFNVFSAMCDKLKYPQSYAGKAPWARGFPEEMQGGTDGAAGVPQNDAGQVFNANYGLSSRSKVAVDELGAGSRRYYIELSYCPFFQNKKLIPLALSGGLEIVITFARLGDALVGVSASEGKENGAPASTTDEYTVKNLKFHCQVSYANDMLNAALQAEMKSGGLNIPYSSYASLQHNPKSVSESVRMSSALEHLEAIYLVHRFTSDLNTLTKASLAHFGNPKLEEVQFSSGGKVQPTTALICTTSSGTKYSGEAYVELQHACKTLDINIKEDAQFNKTAMEIPLATSNQGTAYNANGSTGPLLTDVSKWNGACVYGLVMNSGKPFTSIYNRTSSMFSASQKSDLIGTFKYTSDPSAFTMNAFLKFGNIMRIEANGVIIPEQLSF